MPEGSGATVEILEVSNTTVNVSNISGDLYKYSIIFQNLLNLPEEYKYPQAFQKIFKIARGL